MLLDTIKQGFFTSVKTTKVVGQMKGAFNVVKQGTNFNELRTPFAKLMRNLADNRVMNM